MFTTSGTWMPPPGVTAVQVQVQGAGGTGGDANGLGFGGYGGGGGGGGGYVQAVVNVTPGTTYPVVVGVAANNGLASCGADPGFKGGNSSFNGIVAGGGFGGGVAQVFPHFGGGGGAGGSVTGGVSSFFGQPGGTGTLTGGGPGGLPGSSVFVSPTAPAYGTGGQGSNNCEVTSILAQPGFVRISW
jgi:hypothetical protein